MVSVINRNYTGDQSMAKNLFQPGHSGNIAGRPKGALDKRTVYRKLIEHRADELISKALEMALEGNEAMLRLLLERILPAKPRNDPLNIDFLSGDIIKQNEQIYEQLAAGSISVVEAINLQKTLMNRARVIESCRQEIVEAGCLNMYLNVGG
jgi:SepF-like predicted cell division protein (DUF552 family)